MDRFRGPPKVDRDIVWLPVRIGGLPFKVGALRPGEWVEFHISKPSAEVQDIARALAEKWERDHPDEAAKLFAEAEAFRAAKKP